MSVWREQLLHCLRHPDALPLPFSLVYDGQAVTDLLTDGERELTEGCLRLLSPDDRLLISCRFSCFSDCPAAEWTLQLTNCGDRDSGMIEAIHSLDLTVRARHYTLHRTRGTPSDLTACQLHDEPRVVLGTTSGRSSDGDLPFFRIDVDRGALVVAVGWSGQWRSELDFRPVNRELRLRAGLNGARFQLHPGETVQLPRILVLFHEGPLEMANVLFRRLLRTHYIPRYRTGQAVPIVYFSACGAPQEYWRNQTHITSQLPLIKALGQLEVEAVISDAGSFTAGRPDVMNRRASDPEKDLDAMAAAAAGEAQNAVCGFRFEPEYVASGAAIAAAHPDWVLHRRDLPPTAPGLLNLALPEAREYFLEIISRSMARPGFAAYHQDLSLDPLPYWHDQDESGREGLTEIFYVNGLYVFWDELSRRYPDSLRVNDAGGSRRLDLEGISRFHLHQKDAGGDNLAAQVSLFCLSQYLPNGIIATSLTRWDDYSLHSVAASSLSLDWQLDSSAFDLDQAAALLRRFRRIRSLLSFDWYPLTRSDRSPVNWFGSQYHDPQANEGLLLLFRREDCPYDSRVMMLRGLDAYVEYELVCLTTGHREVLTGEELMDCHLVTLPHRGSATMVLYRPLRASGH